MASIEPEICTVCASKYTPVIRKKITCKYCNVATCSKCIEHYIVTRHEDAHCLHCRVNYNDTVLHEVCTKTYIKNKYYKHRQEVLINRERSQLPALQDTAMHQRKLKDKWNQIIMLSQEFNIIKHNKNNNHHLYNITYMEYSKCISKQTDITELKQLLDDVYQKNLTYRDQLRTLKEQIRHLRWEYRNGENGEHKEEKEEKKKFIRRCTRAECKGFLSTAWKCGMCEWYSCSKCFIVKGEQHDSPHECKKEDIDTAELIKKDSKPCPNCGEFITKSSGCDQMFCITCQTPFSWDTGKIVTSGAIHNPHYYEWIKRNGKDIARNPADIPCGGYPHHGELPRFNQSPAFRNSYGASFYEFHRMCHELQEISTRFYRSHIDNTTTHSINIKFLLNDIDEKGWGKCLAQNEKKKKRDSEIQEILGAFRMIAVELLNRVCRYSDENYYSFSQLPLDIATTFMNRLQVEIESLIAMINHALYNISISYYYSVPYIETITSINVPNKVSYHVSVKTFKNKRTSNKKQNNKEHLYNEDQENDNDNDNDNDDDDEKKEQQEHPIVIPIYPENDSDIEEMIEDNLSLIENDDHSKEIQLAIEASLC